MLELKCVSKKIDNQFILKDISFQFPNRGLIGIQGESGCGKSTLLYILGMLDDHFEGQVLYNGKNILDREQFIREHISFMMQNKDFISAMTVKENILLASQVSNKVYHFSQLKKITTQLGIFDILNKYPSELSGGQLKRVSIAKALMKQSSIILCDEPTGALHETQAHDVMKLLKQISSERLIIIVSHHQQLLQMYCDNVLTLENKVLKGQVDRDLIPIDHEYKQHHYSLVIYSLRQLLFQRNKLLFLFLFQWILIIAFFLITTSINGIWDALQQSEIHSVTSFMLTIENKDKEHFSVLPTFLDSYVQYHYQLDQLQVTSNQKSVTAMLYFLPQNQKHILLQQGRLPKSDNEVIVTESLYCSLNNSNLTISYENFHMNLNIVGVLAPTIFQNDDIYCSDLIKEKLDFLKDEYALTIETSQTRIKTMYDTLSQKYVVYSDVLERIESYQSILSLAKIIACVFIGISLVVSLLLINIVESILYYERKHDVAYLLSLGLKRKRLFVLSIGEAFLLGHLISLGGCFLSMFFYYFINEVYQIQKIFYFSLQLKSIWLNHYDLYIFIILIYAFVVVLGTVFPIKHMMNIDMVDVLREE